MNKKYSEGLKSFVSGDLSVRRFLLPARRQMRAPMYRFCKKPRAYKEELCNIDCTQVSKSTCARLSANG